MIFQRLLRGGQAPAAGARLYASAVAQARDPGLYAGLGAPDTPDGRFELYTLHVLLLIERLRAGGKATASTSQALFDTYLSGLDHGLRELGVGDLSVGKTMRKLGEAFYGRARTFDAAVKALPDRAPLEQMLHRTVYDGAAAVDAGPLATYVLAAREALADASIEVLMDAAIDWPEVA
ncbi:MAG: ubiquinol-cytochrome C chaperone family protein [Caulobacterales bacterium]